MESSIYRLRVRDVLTLCVLSLVCLGVLMVHSAAMNVTGNAAWQWTDKGLKHLVFALVAVGTYFTVGRVDYARLVRPIGVGNPVAWLWVVAFATCAVVLVPGIGIEVNGARRWLPLGIAQVQPSELAKWATVIFLVWCLTYRPIPVERFWAFLLMLVPVGILCLLVVIQDFGTAALIGLCAFCILVVGGAKWWHLLLVTPPGLVGAVGFVMAEPYRLRRMTAFLNPWENPRVEGYHMIQSLLSFSSGGITGKGLGNGVQKLGYLPEDTTDFIFAVICEELGVFGATAVVALYLGILFVVWQVIRRERDRFGRLLAFGIGAMVSLQGLINIAVATVSVPTKGMSLPLVSAGGSGLVITCGALGVLYSITRHDRIDEIEAQGEGRKGFEVVIHPMLSGG